MHTYVYHSTAFETTISVGCIISRDYRILQTIDAKEVKERRIYYTYFSWEWGQRRTEGVEGVSPPDIFATSRIWANIVSDYFAQICLVAL